MNITKENIEVILYDYAEGNLSGKERDEVGQYLKLHPEYREMLDGYDPLLTIPEENGGVFDGEEEFLREIMASNPQSLTEKPHSKDVKTQLMTANSQPKKKKSERIIVITRYIKWISGAAAMFVMFFAIKSIYTLQNTQDTASIENIGEMKTLNNTEVLSKNSAEPNIDTANTHTAVALSHNNKEKTHFFYSKNPLFLLKKPTFFDTDSAKGNGNVQQSGDNTPKGNDDEQSETMDLQYEYTENQNLNEDNGISKPENKESQISNQDMALYIEENPISDVRNQVSNVDYADTEYRIIFFNNKPTFFKRLKRLIGLV